tara:strand:- start:56 stop:1978 length:1923 start_codon:yes stop_codon:yes gene_type:complete
MRILFCLTDDISKYEDDERQVGPKKIKTKKCKIELKGVPKGLIPFSYKIDHKQSEFRELSIPHPRNQLQVVEFYDRCKETILYYCSLSPFSIRKPAKLAQYTFFKDFTHYEKLADDEVIIEQHDFEYEHLRSFFVYSHYSNVYKFYDSYRYHRSEKKFNALLKLDVSKCFDSIYTHTVAWAIYGKEAVKENLTKCNGSFPDRFDLLMQRMNYNETNGILIGPEFSRVFAELILQDIDKKLEKELLASTAKLRHKVDYEIFRYVDDYFVFFNEEQHKNQIVDVLQHCLKEYKLYLNSEKAVLYEKPIITEISRAKRQVGLLLDERINYTLEEIVSDPPLDDDTKKYRGTILIDSKSLIIQFKTILKVCGVEYKDLLNYSLSIVENKCDKILKRYQKADKECRSERQLVEALFAILEFVFFIYSVSPKVNTTIKLCRILRIICSFCKSPVVEDENKHLIYKYIYDDIALVLRKNKSDGYTQVETLYLLIALSELGKDYWLEQEVLANYLNIQIDENDEFKECHELNYFSFCVVMFYMRKKVRYSKLREFIELRILHKFKTNANVCMKKAEMTFLFFDVLACPYVSDSIKEEMLKIYGINDVIMRNEFINYKMPKSSTQQWFTTWHNFDFGKELDHKKGFDVY